MSQSKSSIEERYAAVMELKGGASLSTVGKKYRMGLWTLKALLNRYEKLGIGKGTYARDSGVYTKKEAICRQADSFQADGMKKCHLPFPVMGFDINLIIKFLRLRARSGLK